MILLMLKRLLDSVILIDHLNGVQEAKQFVLALEPEQTAISVITRAEILSGGRTGGCGAGQGLVRSI